jgi:hypothetical protein
MYWRRPTIFYVVLFGSTTHPPPIFSPHFADIGCSCEKRLRQERKKGDAKVAGAREVGAKSEVKKRINILKHSVPYISLTLFFLKKRVL